MNALILTLLIFPVSVSFSQSLFVSPDSTQIVFPDHVTVSLSRSAHGNAKNFKVSSANLKILTTEINFLLNLLKLEQSNVAFYRGNEEILKSSIAVLEKKYQLELERTFLHRDAFERLEKVSATYQTELDRCKSDLNELSQKKARSAGVGFIKGMIGGVVLGAVLGILLDAAAR